jgi:hypothetical protein
MFQIRGQVLSLADLSRQHAKRREVFIGVSLLTTLEGNRPWVLGPLICRGVKLERGESVGPTSP